MSEVELERARHHFAHRAWSEAHRLFSHVDQKTPLCLEDIERFATAAYLVGHDAEFQRILDRAYHLHVKQNYSERAAYCAFWVGFSLMFQGEFGQANGWLARAQRLIENKDCVVQGYLILPLVEQYLDERNDKAAIEASSNAIEIGTRFADADLTTCARHQLGRAIIQQGDVQRGLALLDDAMLALSGGELSPIVTGLIYCSVIDACKQVFAYNRAWEWTSVLARWCEQQPEMVAFTGTCLVHRAEVMQFHGAWGDAMLEASQACKVRAESSERKPPAEAYYRQGEIHRLKGNFDEAYNAFRDASNLGLDPQPGLALLRMAQGNTDSAFAAIRRALNSMAAPLQRANLLPAFVEISLAQGDIPAARQAVSELAEIAQRYHTDALLAITVHALGAVELANGNEQVALPELRQAFSLWQQLGASYEMGRVRVLLGLACRALGDSESAQLEFDAARSIFKRLDSKPEIDHLDSIQSLSGEDSAQVKTKSDVLTRRELQVLREIAAGKTNKTIAKELHLSERTIDRHVSNILAKLVVTSRAAATAAAYHLKLL